MRELNKHFVKVPYKQETLRLFSQIFRPGLWYFKYDLQAAYMSMLVQPWLSDLFGGCFDGVFYVSQTAPFGWVHSARFFNKLMRIVVESLRRRGVTGIIYDWAAAKGGSPEEILGSK
jgi:hypothetical protein